MQSIFNKTCDERVEMAETIALDWIDTHWDTIEEMFDVLQTVPQHTIIVTQSSLKSQEEKVGELYDPGKELFSRLQSYTYHSGDYFPNALHPLILAPDPTLNDAKEVIDGESDPFIRFLAMQSPTTYFVVIGATKNLGDIRTSENIYWVDLPKVVLKEDTLYKTNCVGEVAALIFFGELRYRGVLSHLWADFHYNEIEHLVNRHFAPIVQESLLVPFYLSPKISKKMVWMGFAYEQYKPQNAQRKLSPVRRKRVASPSSVAKTGLKSKPTITRPPSPPRSSPKSNEKSKNKRKKSTPKESRVPSEPEQRVSILPPSPQRTPRQTSPPGSSESSESPLEEITEDRSDDIILPKKKHKPIGTAQKKKQKPINAAQKKKRKTIVNPKTGRKIIVGGGVYLDLVEKGIITEEGNPTSS